MADSKGYPQIPGRVWWGVRDMIFKSPNMKFDENNLAVTLSVQPVAARQYLKELERVGILAEDGSTTDLGKKWRLDEQYEEAVSQILTAAYPAGLIDIAPIGAANRNSVERWFQNDGLGSGTAKNKAGTYVMIANERPGENKIKASPKASKKAPDSKPVKVVKTPPVEKKGDKEPPKSSMPPLNVNVQIHISADASSEQIETIFSAMRKYLGNEIS